MKRSLASNPAMPSDERCVTARKYASPAIERTSAGERFSLGPRRSPTYFSDDLLGNLQAQRQFHQLQEFLVP